MLFLYTTASWALTYPMPPASEDLVGQIQTITVQHGDSLFTLAQRFDVGRNALIVANPHIRFHRLRVGQKVIIPTQFILPPPPYRNGITVNISEMRLYYFTPNNEVMTFPVALGRMGWRTPTTDTKLIRKQAEPDWNVPNSIRQYTYKTQGKWLPAVVKAGPRNPLGTHALYLQRRGYLMHGTNQPALIGSLVSSGCIRMYNHDVEVLFEHVPVGTTVHIIHHPQKAGWLDGTLYLESHKPVDHNEPMHPRNYTTPEAVIESATAEQQPPTAIDWERVERIAQEHTGIPKVIHLPPPPPALPESALPEQ